MLSDAPGASAVVVGMRACADAMGHAARVRARQGYPFPRDCRTPAGAPPARTDLDKGPHAVFWRRVQPYYLSALAAYHCSFCGCITRESLTSYPPRTVC